MNKPDIPLDCMPSTLLYYNLYSLPFEARDLIQRCSEIRLQADWQGIDDVALGTERLALAKVEKCHQAIVLVHLADTCWMADRLELAHRSYHTARETFTLLCDVEQRHNEAAAAYGQGLVNHALGNAQDAQSFYNQALRLLQESKMNWGAEGQSTRCRQCAEIGRHIEHMKKLTMDAPFPPFGTSSRPTPGGIARRVHPVLLGSVPADGTDSVPTDTPIILLFDRPIQTATFSLDIEPREKLGQIPPPTWWEGDTVAVIRLTHGTLDYAVNYQITIVDAWDKDGNALGDGTVAKSWSFTTQDAPGISPVVVQFLGSNQPLPRGTPIVIVFNKPVDPATVRPNLDPNPGGVKTSWDPSHTVFVLEHNGFQVPQAQVTITDVVDKQGNKMANPAVQSFNFSQQAAQPATAPKVLAHCPPANGTGIAADIPFVLLFDQPVGQVALRTNPQLAYQRASSPQPCKLVFVFHHSNLLFEKSYGVDVEWSGAANPYAWTFRTQSRPLILVPILGVAPVDGATGVPRSVNPLVVFTRQMSTNPADLDWTPKSRSCSASWSVDPLHRVAVIHPAKSAVRVGKRNTWKIVKACDDAGNDLIAPGNPYSWTFEFERIPRSPPTITSRKPDRDLLNVAVDVPIEITFSEAMDETRFEYEISPKPGQEAIEWDRAKKVATIRHSDFEYAETYTIGIKEAYAQDGFPLLAGSEPINWSFTTESKQGKPIICYTYPCNNDVDVALRTPLLIMFDQPIRTFGLELDPPPPKKQTRSPKTEKWSADRSAVQLQLPILEPDTEYKATIRKARNDRGEDLGTGRFSSAPNPWQFRTMEDPLRRGQAVQNLNLASLAVMATFLILAIMGLLWLWRGWQPTAAFLLALVLTVALVVLVLRRRPLFFAVSASEEAVFQTQGRLRVIHGPQSSFWRIPPNERLRAVIPTRPLTFQVTGCKFTNAHQEQIELVIDLQYRVFNSLAAFRCLLQARGEEGAESIVFSEKDLQGIWQKEICEAIALESSSSLQRWGKNEITKRKEDIEEELTKALLPTTYRMGIELQGLRIVHVRGTDGQA